MEQGEIEKLKQAGRIAKQVAEYARTIINPKTPLLEIAEKIESKIIELGAKPAFPVNLSVNEVAAHSTPSFDDKNLAQGLLKVDIGVNVDGYIADTAFSLDLENSEENKKLIKSAEDCLNSGCEVIKLNIQTNKIGGEIEKTAMENNALPIHNLSGHSIQQYELHAGITIPNYDNSKQTILNEGVYAIEPFVTLSIGAGSVKDGKPSGIYIFKKEGGVREQFARQVLQYIAENYNTLPFCQRWIHKQFGSRSVLALKQLEQAGIIHQYPQLIESSNTKVAQAEHTIFLSDKEKIITTG